MKVMVVGATGLIGSHVANALENAGCTVVGCSRQKPSDTRCAEWRELDFSAMTSEQAWLAQLSGIDAVVNCVGIIREIQPGDFDRLHRAAPVALFAACERLGISRVIQVSALGSKTEAPTAYWRSKGEAETDLLRRRLNATIVRPSLVYGSQGASSLLFLALATLPIIAMPMANHAQVQPIHVDDLAAAIVKLVTTNGPIPQEMAVVGPHPMTMAGYLSALRSGLQAPAAIVLELPMRIARIVARVAALNPVSALTPDSLLMLEKSADGSNTADAGPITAWLGRPLRDPSHFAAPEQRPAAVLSWGLSLIRIAIAVLWLITAVVSWFGWPHQESARWLAACGVPVEWQTHCLLAASLLDGAIGIALLLRPRRWLWPLQIGLVFAYTVVMSIALPEFWLHPFGPLSKNLPILAAMAMMWRLSEKRN